VANSKVHVYMRFRLAPRSMTLDDLELLFPTFGVFRGILQILARWRWRLLQSTIISRHFSCFDNLSMDFFYTGLHTSTTHSCRALRRRLPQR